jgi:hypothetical protein
MMNMNFQVQIPSGCNKLIQRIMMKLSRVRDLQNPKLLALDAI